MNSGRLLSLLVDSLPNPVTYFDKGSKYLELLIIKSIVLAALSLPAFAPVTTPFGRFTNTRGARVAQLNARLSW